MGISFSIELKTDAAAALGVVNRRGIGKMRHISTLEQLMQNAIRNQEVEVQQITPMEETSFRTHTHKGSEGRSDGEAHRGNESIQQERDCAAQISAVSRGGERCTPDAAAVEGAAAMT